MPTYKVLGISDVSLKYKVGANISSIDVPYGANFTINNEADEITFEGDNDREVVWSAGTLSGRVEADKWDDTVIQKLLNRSKVESGLPGDEASRTYFGDTSEPRAPYVGFTVDLAAIDETDDAERRLRIHVFKARIKPYSPANVQNKAKMGMGWDWQAVRTTSDLVGTALPSVPTGGATYAIAVLAS